MNFDLTPDQEEFRGVIRRFADEVVAPDAAGRDEREEFPLEVVRAMASLGLFGLPLPERSGGSDADTVTCCLVVEELGRVDQSVAITLSAAMGLGGAMVHRFGSEAQQDRWLGPIARGEILTSFALTEPGGGSDAAATTTTAREDGAGWVIDGAKAFITNAGTPLTGLHVVTAATEPGGGRRGLSTFLVPADSPGITVERTYRKIGWRASDTRGLVFQGCRVPGDALLGERGRGFAQCLELLGSARIAIAALAVGLAQACVEEGVSYAKQRRAFGRPIGANQMVQARIADMQTRLAAARLLTYEAAWLKDQGRRYVAQASIAKLAASEAAVTCARDAVQLFGGSGFMEETKVARAYRDAKVLEIGEGTSEIQRLIIARELGLPVEF